MTSARILCEDGFIGSASCPLGVLVSAVRVNWYRRSGEKRRGHSVSRERSSLFRREKKKIDRRMKSLSNKNIFIRWMELEQFFNEFSESFSFVMQFIRNCSANCDDPSNPAFLKFGKGSKKSFDLRKKLGILISKNIAISGRKSSWLSSSRRPREFDTIA